MSSISGLHDDETSQEDGVLAALAGGDSTEEDESDNTANFEGSLSEDIDLVQEMINEESYEDEAVTKATSGCSGSHPWRRSS